MNTLTRHGFDRAAFSVIDSAAPSGPCRVSNELGYRKGFSVGTRAEYLGRGHQFRECAEAGCAADVGEHGARGFCSKHYKRLIKHGTTVLPEPVKAADCRVGECPKKAHAHGYCGPHLYRVRKFGDPNGERQTPTLADRFWPKVDKTPGQGPTGECWIWTATLHKGDGRGQVLGSVGKVVYANRAAWELEYGPIPEGMVVCHRCDHPSCVRPEHLFLGTLMDNTLDMISKGRGAWQRGVPWRRGEFHEKYLRDRARRSLR